MEKTRMGIIGIGGWGKNLLRNFSELEEAEVAYAADLVEDRLESARSKYPDTRMTKDYREILADESIRAVVVATPGSSHYRLAREALEAGKDVYIEKPMTLTSAESRMLLETAEQRDRIVMVGHLLLYHPAVVKLREQLSRGTIGDLHYIYTQRVNLGKIRRSENALWTFAPHDISVILHLVEKQPVSVAAWGNSYVQEGVEDVVFVRVAFHDGVMAHIHVSWLDPHKIRRITLVGSRGMMVFDDMDAAAPVRIYDKGVSDELEYDSFGEYLNLRYGEEYVPWLPSGEPLKLECAHFLESVSSRKAPLTDARNGLAVVSILEAAQNSLEAGGEIVNL